METFKSFQDPVTLSVTPAAGIPGEIVQSRCRYLDRSDEEVVLVHVEIPSLPEGSLHLETAVSEEGPWFPVCEPFEPPSPAAAIDVTIQLATHYSAEHPLGRFLRWRFTTDAGTAGRITFRLRYR